MAYEPLHHKYRPQTFAELVGQEAIATTLTNALRQQKIAPAYLFTGARGTGKTSSARILAKSLNCLSSQVPTEKPCGQCEVCRAIANGSALDVIEIDAASNTGVDNIRELIERAQFAPVQCRYKVYVLDEVHMLTGQAFNALLKTLEEPPDRVVFILATTDPQRVLPTIISRCQRFDYRRIPLEAMVQHLGAIALQESIDIAPEAIQLVSQVSQGGLRDAESLLDQLSLLEGQVTVERVWDLVGAVPERDLLTLVRAIAQDDAITVLDQARHLMDRGREPLIVLQNLAGFYRDLLIAKTSPDRQDLVAITPPTWAELCGFAHGLDIGTILVGQQYLRKSEAQVKNTTQPRLWLEVTLMGLLPSAIREGQETGQREQASAVKVQRAVPIPQPPLPKQVPALNSNSPSVQSVEPVAPAQVTPQADTQPIPSQAQPNMLSELDPAVTSANGATVPPPPEVQPEAQPKIQPDETPGNQRELDQIWQDVLNLVQPFSTQIMLRQQCHLIAFKGHEARIGTKSQPLFRMAKERLPNVEAAFERLCNQKVKVSLEVVVLADSPAPAASEAPSPRISSFEPTSASAPGRVKESGPPPELDREKVASNSFQYSSGSRQEITPVEPTLSNALEDSAPSLTPAAWQEEDEVARAAKSLAHMFNGQIVSQEGNVQTGQDSEAIALTQSAVLEEPEPESESDDDVPF